MIVRNMKRTYQVLHIRMIADNHLDVGIQVSRLPQPKQFPQTMILFRDKDRQLFLDGGGNDPPFHLKLLRHLAEILAQFRKLIGQLIQIEFDPHEKAPAIGIHAVLVRLYNIGAVFKQKSRHRRHDSRPVWTRNEHAAAIARGFIFFVCRFVIDEIHSQATSPFSIRLVGAVTGPS